ncbi:hypothetical protein ACE6H2_004858 [Prunus campanulata]
MESKLVSIYIGLDMNCLAYRMLRLISIVQWCMRFWISFVSRMNFYMLKALIWKEIKWPQYQMVFRTFYCKAFFLKLGRKEIQGRGWKHYEEA